MMRLANKNRRGFTLIELMIVIAIIGILAAIAIPNFSKARKQARLKACIANMRTLEGAIEMYDMDSTGSNVVSDGAVVSNAGQFVGIGVQLQSGRYLKSPPVCKSGGAYNIINAPNATEISCDKHGTVSNSQVPQ
ncbi:MAG: hypothetical protein CVV64_03605 [Candidatus Wallbacteria bacterium HGW-Wallbacteria-1]|jgi:prepilin-type N-terminal cleavage/methylation domain-containing protein|uniref:Prepilin-type cleavage/methylation domain-containing protein n=1 Tax=Candidatus Wallbacteria bacterium HGW-Wallbacteria-1 TaxID=2013854 RepID=A0A2N1PTU5_9BACT|nr:MAG: hypothetical protein CVV64_03605 [Candidatus Wallbacteria bacterium HGW-Wallbacteria-1]